MGVSGSTVKNMMGHLHKPKVNTLACPDNPEVTKVACVSDIQDLIKSSKQTQIRVVGSGDFVYQPLFMPTLSEARTSS